jgi:transposase-like protein
MAKQGERDPKRERFWRAALRRQEKSGLTAKEFCRREQLAETAYYYWRRELARRDREAGSRAERQRVRASAVPEAAMKKQPVASPPLFRELAILDGPSSAADRGLEIMLPNGCRLRLSAAVDRRLLADVLQTLETPRC